MSALATGLLGLAALFAARGVGAASLADVRRGAGVAVARPRTRAMRPRAWIAPAGGVVGGIAIAGAWGGAVGAAIGLIVMRTKPRRGRAKLRVLRDEQLADAVAAVASAMRAGQSLTQALAYAADGSDEPLRSELAHVVRAVDTGADLDMAFADFGSALATEDARLVAAALAMHRRTGGDLPVVLDQVALTVRERLAVAREVRALTAQARLSGLILGLLPIGFFGFLWLTSRRDIEAALATPAGVASVTLGLILEIGAFAWIRHLLEVG